MTEKTTKELFSEATVSLLGGESGCFFCFEQQKTIKSGKKLEVFYH